MARHKHADLMIEAANNWDGMEWRCNPLDGTGWGEWYPLKGTMPEFYDDYEYEIRPIRREVCRDELESDQIQP